MVTSLDILMAKQEISEVLFRYCRGIDRLDEELVRSCYHPDAVDYHGHYDGSVDYFIERAFDRQSGIDIACHAISNIFIEVNGDAAVSESSGRAIERHRADGKYLDDLIVFRYVDRFERRDGGPWLIARRTVVIDWLRQVEVEEGELASHFRRRGSRDRNDFIYAELARL